MKKIILTVSAVFAFGFMDAQETKFGVKGGVNFATLTGDAEDVSMKVGFNVGGFVEIKVSDKFSVQPELLYSTQGARTEISEFDGFNFDAKVNLGYLNIPIMARYYVANKFSLEAGPQVGFLLSAKGKAEVMEGGVTTSAEEDIKDEFESIDFGVNFGAGYDFTKNLSANVRYNFGLTNIAKDSGNDKANNSVLSLSLGYKF